MKKILISILAIAALVSCSKNSIVDMSEGEAITFGNVFVDNSTKAADMTYSGDSEDKVLTSFNLYGTVTGTAGTVNIYNGCEVTGEVGTNVWTCPVNQYWIAGANYSFAAVVDGQVASINDNGMPLTIRCNTTVYDNNIQKDLLYATASATGQASANAPVNFTFSHLLSKAQFTVTSNTTNGWYYSVKDIKINNYLEGTYTIASGVWVGTSKDNTLFGNIENVTSSNKDGKTCNFQRLLIPTTEDFTVTFTVELWNDNGDETDVKISTQSYTKTVSQDLKAGNAYDFNINLSVGELIQFTVTENPTWENNPGADVTIQ